MKTVLLTGFEPFGGSAFNPSGQIASTLHGETIGDARVVGLTLPVVMGEDADLLTKAIADHRPALVLCLGLASGATCLEAERFAVNLRFAEPGSPNTPVRSGLPQSAIIADGMAAMLATVNAETLAAAICEAGVPARAHGYAGAYACNHVLYHALHYAFQWELSYRAGFLHLPLSSEQALAENRPDLPSLPLETMTRGVRAAIKSAS